MERQYVESSNLLSIGYDASLSILEIEFKTSQIWQYYDVPESLWYEFENSGSKGKFFWANIRGKYSENRIG